MSQREERVDPLLVLDKVGVNYHHGPMRRDRGRWVFNDVSLKLYRGEALGVIGRNGMGKSTLLRLMAGILKPDRGRYKLRKGCHASLLSLQVGFDPHLSGRENIFLSGLLMGMRYRDIETLYPSIVAFAELENDIDRSLATYSDGMRARLGFAIAYQMDPDILLIDEVLGVGDASFRKKSGEMMKQRIRSDRTVVLVSHNPTTIRELCTRAVWIGDGKTQAEGKVDVVMDAYEDYLARRRLA